MWIKVRQRYRQIWDSWPPVRKLGHHVSNHCGLVTRIQTNIQSRDSSLARRDETRRDTGCLVSRETNYHRDSETKKVVIWADFRRKMPCFINKSTTPISHGGYHDSKLYIVVQKMRIIQQFARMDKFDEN